MTPLDSRFLKTFLTRIESRVPYMYAILRHLSPEFFYIFRFNDIANEIDGLDDPENNLFTLTEFLLAADSFYPKEHFGLFFAARPERLSEAWLNRYGNTVCLSAREYATSRVLVHLFDGLLDCYCEKCLREGQPFELTPRTIARFRFRPRDVEFLKPLIEKCNAIARMQIQDDKR